MFYNFPTNPTRLMVLGLYQNLKISYKD